MHSPADNATPALVRNAVAIDWRGRALSCVDQGDVVCGHTQLLSRQRALGCLLSSDPPDVDGGKRAIIDVGVMTTSRPLPTPRDN